MTDYQIKLKEVASDIEGEIFKLRRAIESEGPEKHCAFENTRRRLLNIESMAHQLFVELAKNAVIEPKP